MTSLYIIGNGFDLSHGLPTTYSDFQNYMTKHFEELETTLENYFTFKYNEQMLWTSFEKDLSTFDWTRFLTEHCNIDIWDENFKPSNMYSIEDEISDVTYQLVYNVKQTFKDWLSAIEIKNAIRKIDFPENSFFLNFNYTLTLETIYQIESKNIFHVHGDLNSEIEDLIFGHGAIIPDEPELDDFGNSNRTLLTDSQNAAKYPLAAFYKPVSDIILKHKNLFGQFKEINSITILGHSLNYIDIPYFKEIASNAKNSEWNVSYFLESEKKSHLSILKELGIPTSKINLFTFI